MVMGWGGGGGGGGRKVGWALLGWTDALDRVPLKM